MVDEAFALSPISARAAQPSEADYDAIQEAFMETSRGRWFLGEYAKRNRNADTKMVLEAVSRIEETIAAQKKPSRDPLLDEALTSLRGALAQARSATTAAIGDLALEQNLAPVRKGARVIREIAWRLREIGADGRICDLIDSQVSAIEGAAGKLNSADLAAALHGAFERVEGQIAAFDAVDAAAGNPAPRTTGATPPAETASAIQPEPQAEMPAEPPVAANEAAPTAAEVKVEASTDIDNAEIQLEINAAAVDPVVAGESAIVVASEPAGEPVNAFDAHDEAMLDMVAMEMAAPDTDEAYEPRLDDAEADESGINGHPIVEKPEAPEAGTAEPHVASWEIDVTFKSDGHDAVKAPAAATALPLVTPLQPAPETVPEPLPAAMTESAPSLGSSLLANGIVPRPRSSGPDPLAPIRRMTQSEKIAFFS